MKNTTLCTLIILGSLNYSFQSNATPPPLSNREQFEKYQIQPIPELSEEKKKALLKTIAVPSSLYQLERIEVMRPHSMAFLELQLKDSLALKDDKDPEKQLALKIIETAKNLEKIDKSKVAFDEVKYLNQVFSIQDGLGQLRKMHSARKEKELKCEFSVFKYEKDKDGDILFWTSNEYKGAYKISGKDKCRAAAMEELLKRSKKYDYPLCVAHDSEGWVSKINIGSATRLLPVLVPGQEILASTPNRVTEITVGEKGVTQFKIKGDPKKEYTIAADEACPQEKMVKLLAESFRRDYPIGIDANTSGTVNFVKSLGYGGDVEEISKDDFKPKATIKPNHALGVKAD